MRFNTAEVRKNTEQIKNEIRELSIEASITTYDEFLRSLTNGITLSYDEFKKKVKLDTSKLETSVTKTLDDQVKKNVKAFTKQMEAHGKTKSGTILEPSVNIDQQLGDYIEAIRRDAYNKYLSMINTMVEATYDL